MAGNPDYGRKLFLEFCDSLETNVEEILKYGVNFQYEKFLKKPDIEEDPRLFEIEVRDFYRGEYFGKSEHHLQDGYGLRSEQEISINDVLKLVSRRDTQEIPAAFSKSKEFLHAIVVGPAGSGKTTFIKKLAKDVMLGKYDQESTAKKLVHVIECHNFNEEDTMTVPEFLFSNMHHKPSTTAIEEGYKRILQNSKCITFFVDSLDTLIYQLDDEKRIIGPYDTAPPATILYNIFIGSIFSESKVISSSREFKIRKYKNPLRPDRIIALGGLRRESIRKLVFGFLDEDEAIRVWEILVLECPDLMNLCEIPICLIFTLIGLIEKESSNIIPKTMSGIMVRVLESLIHSEHAQAFGRHDEEYVITAIDKMKKLAFQGMKEGRVMFKENDLKQVNLSVEEITDLAIVVPGKSFQHQQILGGTDLVEFCHQTLQEMLAALHILKMNTSEFHEFVAEFLHKDLFIVVRRMLCGIVLNSEVWEAASEHLITENKDIDEIVEILNESLSDKFKEISNDRIDLLEVIRAIHEAGNGAKDIVPSHIESIHLGGAPLLISDFFALASSLFHCETLDELHLSTCRLTPDLLQHFSMRNLSSKCQVNK